MDRRRPAGRVARAPGGPRPPRRSAGRRGRRADRGPTSSEDERGARRRRWRRGRGRGGAGARAAAGPDDELEAEAAPEDEAEAAEREAAEHAAGEIDVPDGLHRDRGLSAGHRRHVARRRRAASTARSRTACSPRRSRSSRRRASPRDAVTVMPVPGAFELPLAAMALAKTRRFSCVVTLGCVIRGETPHFDYVAGEAASGIQLAAIETGVPVSFGVLTCDTVEQAEARIDEGRRGGAHRARDGRRLRPGARQGARVARARLGANRHAFGTVRTVPCPRRRYRQPRGRRVENPTRVGVWRRPGGYRYPFRYAFLCPLRVCPLAFATLAADVQGLRNLRQEAGVRQQPEPLDGGDEAPLQPEPAAHPRLLGGSPHARVRLHALPQGRQGHQGGLAPSAGPAAPAEVCNRLARR